MQTRWFLLDWKKALGIAVAWAAAVLLHNAIYALTAIEEVVFFGIAVFLIPAYLVVCIVYTISSGLRKRKKE